ncbi:DNA-damage-inducible protein F [hydrothermal vent metagenome]|uniref:DNA-damage-inducible protein F n=1 Tax=hydrothermal vent metagenome TaxID=652676 RepID=A0A3B1BUG1_9ZZZZ
MKPSINKQILSLAIPNILTNLSVPLLSSVDTAVVGHLDKVYYLGAIAVGSMIFNFIYWGFGFLRMGTTGLTSQAFGQSDDREISLNLFRPLAVALISGFALMMLQYFIAEIAFYVVDASPEVEKFAKEYFYIRIYAAPATLAIYVFHGWFLGLQNARYPMIILVTVNVLNVIFNLLFIYQFDMKSDGVALGTVIAQYSGLLISVLLFTGFYKKYLKYFTFTNLLEFSKLKTFFKVNTDIFIRTLALVFVFSFFTAESAAYGDDILAANTILMQLWIILAYAVDGFAFAAESLVGKFIGAGDRTNLVKSIKLIFAWGIGLGLFFTVVYSFLGYQIIAIYTNNETVIALTLSFLFWAVISQLINSVSFIWDGIYIGATATSAMRNMMLLSTLFVFIPTYFILKESYGNNALWLALVLFMVSRALFLTLLAKRSIFSKV